MSFPERLTCDKCKRLAPLLGDYSGTWLCHYCRRPNLPARFVRGTE